jgi:amino acid transporter
MTDSSDPPHLRRALGLPMLVFYGVGVTIGAGIFALVGEIVHVAGDHAPMAFLLAGLIAAATGFSYALLVGVYPRAAGEAVFVTIGMGPTTGRLVGLGVTLTAIISSAVIAIAFGGYLGTLVPLAQPVMVIGILLVLATVAWLGVRESVAFAAGITLLEVGTLVVIAVAGSPMLADASLWQRVATPPAHSGAWTAVFSASVLAFFAFVGFEDLENMAEETIDPKRVLPKAIALTLLITVVLYVLIAMIAVALPDRGALTGSRAPLAVVFERVTGWSGRPIAAVAAIAMVNGILIQIVMASRVIYGMGRDGLVPAWLGRIDARRRTPSRAIALITVCIAALALGVPLVGLAQTTSALTLSVFTLVNLALWRIGGRTGAAPVLRRWRHAGLAGALLSAGLLAPEIWRLLH